MRMISISHLILRRKANKPISLNVDPFFQQLNDISVLFLFFFIVTYTYLFLGCIACSMSSTVNNTYLKFQYFTHYTLLYTLSFHFPLICSRNTDIFSFIVLYVLLVDPFHNLTVYSELFYIYFYSTPTPISSHARHTLVPSAHSLPQP